MKQRNIPFAVLILLLCAVVVVACGRTRAQEAAVEQPAAQAEQLKEQVPAAEAPQQVEAEPEKAEAAHEEEHVEATAEHPETEGHKEAAEHQEDVEQAAAEHPQEEAGHAHGPEEHMVGHHDVPAEAAAAKNPVPATDESIALGAKIYAQNCAVCHGATGEGDGPAAATLKVKPANLHEDHVQVLSDGALFWIITHGKPNSPMPPWDNVLTETERWHVVNFLRTFGQGQTAEQPAEEHEDATATEEHHHEDAGQHEEDEGHAHDAGEGQHEDEGHAHDEGDHHH
jgi:mono/diheme cytochrome c family protein